MSKRALYSLIPLAVLAGCSLFQGGRDDNKSGATHPPGSSFKCTEKHQCRVTVVVRACSEAGITANPNTLRVARGLRDVPIVWTLQAPAGYTFATDGINFKNKDLAARQFKSSKHSANEFVWEDQNSAPGTFWYNIKVKHRGEDCPFKDPIIINDDTSP